jgi:hypothetical protein
MTRQYMVFVVSVSIVVSGCSKGDPKPPHNEHFFETHSKERAEQLRKCRTDQNKEHPLSCIAAENAQTNADLTRDMGR